MARNFFHLQKCKDKLGKQIEMRIHLIVCYCSRNSSGHATADLSSLYAHRQSVESISEVGWKGIVVQGLLSPQLHRSRHWWQKETHSLAWTTNPGWVRLFDTFPYGPRFKSVSTKFCTWFGRDLGRIWAWSPLGLSPFFSRKANICSGTTSTSTSTYVELPYTFFTARFKLELVCHCSARSTSPFYIGNT
jgi:hypothetical protein